MRLSLFSRWGHNRRVYELAWSDGLMAATGVLSGRGFQDPGRSSGVADDVIVAGHRSGAPRGVALADQSGGSGL